MFALRATASRAITQSSRAGFVRSFSGYDQPPLSQGKGGAAGKMPSDDEQATGREREELKAASKGIEYFNRHPIQMQKGQGSFANPVLVPSELPDRIVGMVPKVSLLSFFLLHASLLLYLS